MLGLLVTATLLLLTIDRSLNAIWRTPRPRPPSQRVMLFWAWLTAGPLLVAFTLGQLSLAAAVSSGWFGAIPGATAALGTLVSWLLMGVMFGVVYRVIPNTEVLWRDALSGGLVAAVAFSLASRAFAWYIGHLPTYEAVYGAFATLPLALIWIYWSWLVVLGGALVSAWLPALRAGELVPDPGAGGDFLLAVKVARSLSEQRQQPPIGMSMAELVRRHRHTDPRRMDAVLDVLQRIGWVGLVDTAKGGRRWVLLVDPQAVTLAPLIDAFLLDEGAAARSGFALGKLISREAMTQPLLAVPLSEMG